MPQSISDQLKPGTVYTRDQLREMFGITDATLNNGIFHPKDTSSVWLFVTEEKTPDRVQYKDHLDGDVLLMAGQTEGRTDGLITDHVAKGLELLVFYRTKKYEHEGAGFRYLGQFNYIRSFGRRPTSFVLLREDGRQFKYGKQTWRWALEAVQHGCRTRFEIEHYIGARVPGFNTANVDPDLRMLSVNDFGRSNWEQNRSPRRTDGWNPYDAVYRIDLPDEPFYEMYDPRSHGVWELAADAEGVMRPFFAGESPEIVRVQDQAQAEHAFDVRDDTDGRNKVMANIVRRRGQPKFRRELIQAYGGTCAVTGCTVLEILEAAHIKAYMGDHTNHVKNGLLLRADIHTLFDLGLLRVHPGTLEIEVSPPALAGYAEYHGRRVELPAHTAKRPDRAAFEQHYEKWKGQFGPAS